MSDAAESSSAADQATEHEQEKPEEETVEKLQERLREAMDRATPSDQQQQQQQQPPAAASGGSEEMKAGPESEVSKLKDKVARQQRDLGDLDAAKADTDALIAAVKQDPNLYARILNAHQSKQQKLRQAMEDGEQDILDRLTADFIAAGKTPDAELLASVKAGKDHPEAFAPLFKYLNTAASAAANKEIQKVEEQYQAAKSENAEMKRLLQQSEKVMSRIGDDRDRQRRVDKFTGNMKRGAPESADAGAQRAAKAPRTSDDDDSHGASEGTASDFEQRWRHWRAPRAKSSAAPKDLRPPPFTVPQEALENGLLDLLMQGSADRTGIERVDYKNLVGREFQPMIEGTSDGGFMLPNVGELRSAGPPQ